MTTAAQRRTGARRAHLALVTPAEPVPAPGGSDRAAPGFADGDAIGEVWRTHSAALMRFALKLTLGDRQRAEDILQETMVRAWRHPEVVACGVAAIRPWLFTVTRHVAIDMWRCKWRTDDMVEDLPLDRPDPAEHAEQIVTALDVQAALARLTPKHRKVIVALYCEDRSVAEIATDFDIPEGTVKSRAHYGLRQLKRVMSAAAYEEPAAGMPSPLPLPLFA